MFFRRKQKTEDTKQSDPKADKDSEPAVTETPVSEKTETAEKKKETSTETTAEQPPETKPPEIKQTAPKRSYRALRILAYWVTILSIWCFVALLGTIGYYALTLPDPVLAGLNIRPPNVSIVAEDGKVIANRGMRREHIPLDEIPAHLVNAVLAIEDSRFYSHLGLDPIGIIRASWVNYKAGKTIQGGSTITQQLAKNLYFSSEKTYARKFQESIAAFWLEMQFSKKEILELYLNRVYFGAGAYGIEAAAHEYFSKSAKQLSLAESALLAGLLKAPSRYNPSQRPQISRSRTRRVLKRMIDLKLIQRRKASRAMVNPANTKRPIVNNNFSYIADWVMERLPGYIGNNHQNLIVETTIDRNLQWQTQRSLARIMNREGRRNRAHQAAAIIFDHRGAVKALSGGRSHVTSPFNRAVKALRQPGSAFKPFVYLSALETGLRPNSIVLDRPVTVQGWSPRNYGGYYRGNITMQRALSSSVNTVAVRLFIHAGRDRVVKTARRLGITTEIHKNPTLALGTAEVSLMELTAAYIPFANGGIGILPHIISRIKTIDGKVLYTRRGHGPGRIIDAQHVRDMNRMMHAVVTKGTGKKAWFPNQAIAGKTGTSQNFRDAWFLGFTPYYTMGVWVGNDNNQYMRSVTGGSIPAKIWKDVMQKAHRGLRPRTLPGLYE